MATLHCMFAATIILTQFYIYRPTTSLPALWLPFTTPHPSSHSRPAASQQPLPSSVVGQMAERQMTERHVTERTFWWKKFGREDKKSTNTCSSGHLTETTFDRKMYWNKYGQKIVDRNDIRLRTHKDQHHLFSIGNCFIFNPIKFVGLSTQSGSIALFDMLP